MIANPFIYEINTWVWLDELSRRDGTAIDLASVPLSDWDAIGELGFDAVWLMGVWERSAAGTEIALEDADGFLPPRAARLAGRGREADSRCSGKPPRCGRGRSRLGGKTAGARPLIPNPTAATMSVLLAG